MKYTETMNSGIRAVIKALILLMITVMCVALRNGLYVQAEETSIENVLLIGTDHRDDSWNGNSDVMIVATINSDTKKIILTSFMRDLYADIPGYGVHKLNYAFAVGGAETLEATLEDNYKLSIDHYAVVDFESMADIVDLLGGVELTISDAECDMINGYLNSMDAAEDALPGGGTYVLNGNQAVAHMRDRYVGNNDYERTQRQRDVLTQLFGKLDELGAEEIAGLSKELLMDVEHDFNALEIIELLAEIPEFADYELEENRIPYDDLYTSQGEMLVPDFEETITRLHETIGD
jgi:LCP family protein required for cell wall assembly